MGCKFPQLGRRFVDVPKEEAALLVKKFAQLSETEVTLSSSYCMGMHALVTGYVVAMHYAGSVVTLSSILLCYLISWYTPLHPPSCYQSLDPAT